MWLYPYFPRFLTILYCNFDYFEIGLKSNLLGRLRLVLGFKLVDFAVQRSRNISDTYHSVSRVSKRSRAMQSTLPFYQFDAVSSWSGHLLKHCWGSFQPHGWAVSSFAMFLFKDQVKHVVFVFLHLSIQFFRHFGPKLRISLLNFCHLILKKFVSCNVTVH